VPVTALAAIAAVAVGVTLGTGGGDGGSNIADGAIGGAQAPGQNFLPGSEVPPAPAMRPAAQLLSSTDSCADLLTKLRKHTAAHVTSYGPGVNFGSFYKMAPLSAGKADTAAAGGNIAPQAAVPSAAEGTSVTNDQEAGVDEPDIVKTEAGRVVTITDGTLRVLDAGTGAITGQLDLSIYSGWENAQLLVDGDNALVLLGYSYYGTSTRSTYLFVNLVGAPAVTGSFRASGGYLTARLIGDTVRLVLASSPVINFPQPNYGNGVSQQRFNEINAEATKTDQGIVQNAPLSAWQPSYQLTVGSDTASGTVPCGQIAHPENFTGESMISVYTLDLAHPSTQMAAPLTVAADGSTVYASSTSLYIASDPWTTAAAEGKPQNDKDETTMLHRFDIEGTAAPLYLGSTTIPGRLLDQYSLSEYQGQLRAATTDNWGKKAESSLYVLDAATLKTIGHVDGLGKGQQIYAVRFVGTQAYVVTYQQVDPLYVVDLSDPTKPVVSGSLEVSGYSTYLHDAGEGRIVGVGDEVGSNNEPNGLQVSLFDVSDPSKPTRTGQVVLKDAPSWSRLDPHAFLYWQDSGLVVVPIDGWGTKHSGEVLVLKVDGSTLTKVGLVDNPPAANAHDDGLGIQRSLLVDGKLWTLSGSGVNITDPTSLKQQDWVPFS
jgi:uncharacterized secreted protein with C-terminal beta-propeller domain